MAKSLLLSLFVLALAVVCAFAVRHFGRRADESQRKIQLLFWGFLIGGLAAALFTFTIDLRQRQTTLFEQLLVGSEDVEAGVAVPVRRVVFAVEHPGVEHTLYLMPKPAFAADAGGPVELSLRVRSAGGRVLIQEARTFDVEEVDTGRDLGDVAPGRMIWEGHSWRFTPETSGPHEVEVGIVHVGVHQVFLRIEDPLKRDGERAPGY